MGRQPREIPPPLELSCLKALWDLREGSVKDVRGRLTANRNLAYTTVMTILDRLTKRGAAERRKVGRAFVYAPVLDREHVRKLAVKEFVETYFGGSVEALQAYLNSEPDLTGAESPESADRTDGLDATLL